MSKLIEKVLKDFILYFYISLIIIVIKTALWTFANNIIKLEYEREIWAAEIY